MASGTDSIAAAFAAANGRAALMPYLMGGFPSLDASAAIGEACADGAAASTHATACEDSSAGRIPSSRATCWNAASAWRSVTAS